MNKETFNRSDEIDNTDDLDILSRDELIALARSLRKRIAELEQRTQSEEETNEKDELADGSLPDLPPDLGNAILIQMGAFWDDYDKVVAEVQKGAIFVLTLGDIPRARIEALKEHDATSVKRRELFRQRGKWMKRLEEGEVIAPIDSGLVLSPLPSSEARAVMAHWPGLIMQKAPITSEKRRVEREKKRRYRDSKRGPKERKLLQELREERAQYESANLTEWQPRTERRTPEQRQHEREKMRRYHDSKRTPEELERLQTLREERAKQKS